MSMVFDMIFSEYPYWIDTIWQLTVVSNGSAMFGFDGIWANGQLNRFDSTYSGHHGGQFDLRPCFAKYIFE